MSNTKRENVLGIEISPDEIKEGMTLDDYFYLDDLKNRKIFINDEINPYSVSDAVSNIIRFNKEDKGLPTEERKPILLTITSNGGDVTSGFELIDVILSSKTPVYTINIGWQYSMGFLIGIAGNKRYCMRNSTFLMHDGNSAVWNSGAKAQDQMEFNKKYDDRIKSYVISRSKLTEEEYNAKLRVEWYMFPEEAKEKGFTDYIIGVDCDIDEII